MKPSGARAYSTREIRCLLVERGPRLRGSVSEALSAASKSFGLYTAPSVAAVTDALRNDPPDVTLLEVWAPLESACQAVTETSAATNGAPLVAIGPFLEEEASVELIRSGADDYVREMPTAVAALPIIFEQALERRANSDRAARALTRVQDLESLLRTILSVTETPLLVAAEGGAVVTASVAFADAFGWAAAVKDLPPLDRLISACEPSASGDGARSVLVRCGNGQTVPARQRSAVTSMEGRPWRIVGLMPEVAGDERMLTASGLMAEMNEGRLTLLAGRLQLIGLNEVRDRLGDDWPRWSERAYAVSERVIRARLSNEDVFARNKNGDFIVCFSTLGGDAAWYKAQAIAEEIREKLIGDSAEGELAEVQVETSSVTIAQSELADDPDIASLLSRKLDEKIARLRQNQARLIKEAYEQAILTPQRVYTTDGMPAPVVTAALDPESSARLEALQAAVGGDNLQSEIDLLILDRSIDYVVGSIDHGDKRFLIIPLHYSTLHAQKTRETYMRLCRKLPEAVRGAIGFSIREIPEHLHAGRASELVSQLRHFARLRMLHLTRPDLQGIQLREAGISAIALHYLALTAALRNRPQALRVFIQEIQAQRARFVVTCVPDSAGARKAADQGATMVTFDPARVR